MGLFTLSHLISLVASQLRVRRFASETSSDATFFNFGPHQLMEIPNLMFRGARYLDGSDHSGVFRLLSGKLGSPSA